MRQYISYLGVVGAVLTSLIMILFAPFSYAADLTMQEGADAAQGTDQPADLFGASGIFNTITNVLLFIVGAISVIMIIIGGLRYVTSGGNSSSVTAAKNTILYAVVGLIVAILAYAVIAFVLDTFTVTGSDGTNV